MWGDMRDEITGFYDIRYTRGQFLGLAYLHPVPTIYTYRVLAKSIWYFLRVFLYKLYSVYLLHIFRFKVLSYPNRPETCLLSGIPAIIH